MKKYFYNGVELPELPEWDKTQYPYAVIYLEYNGGYHLSVCNKPFSCGNIPGTLLVALWAENNNSWKSYRTSYDLTHFLLETESSDFTGIYTVCRISDGDTPIWSNTDILNEDGSVLLEASEPFPMVTGKWLFNETIKFIDTVDKMFIGSEISSFVSNGTDFDSIRVVTAFENMVQRNYLQYYTHGVEEYTKVYDYKSKTWLDEAYRAIDYGDKRFGATDEFYAWLTENATQLAPETDPAPQDFYIVKNGVPQKQDVYLRVGGQWVKHDEYLI